MDYDWGASFVVGAIDCGEVDELWSLIPTGCTILVVRREMS